MLELELKEKSNKLNISVDKLINRYIKRGLFMDDYYEAPQLTLEELMELSRKYVEKDMKNGIPPKKHNFDGLIGICNRHDD